MLEEGVTAPDFTLPDQNDEEVTLSSLRGDPVVVYFYPKANTSGCTTQACGVRDHQADYASFGVRVLGISPDEVADIAKFSAEQDLNFTLLADSDHSVAEAYGTWVEKNMYGNKYMGVQRSTFIVDADGKIATIFPKVTPKQHDKLVLKALAELKQG